MADAIFTAGFVENIKVIVVGLLMYVIIFALLKKLQVLGDDPKVNSLVALLAAIIVSFSGVVTYAVSYAINWFVILLFFVFLLLMILMFLGVKMADVAGSMSKSWKILAIIFLLLFIVIIAKSFFAVNNTFDTNNPNNDSYDVDTSFNTGVDDIYLEEGEEQEWDFRFGFDENLLGVGLFLLLIGAVVMFIG